MVGVNRSESLQSRIYNKKQLDKVAVPIAITKTKILFIQASLRSAKIRKRKMLFAGSKDKRSESFLSRILE